MSERSEIFLIPTVISESALETIPAYVLDAVKKCQVFFVENERTARRFLKSIWKEMVIDNYQWFAVHKAEQEVVEQFVECIRNKKSIGILSEAGCPGIADPGQILVNAAHRYNAIVKPLVGPSSILLALMASGMNGQRFAFAGYLPIDPNDRIKQLKLLEEEAYKRNCTQVFIETPYRNNQTFQAILKACRPETRLCIAAKLTAPDESIQTKSLKEWNQSPPDLHKKEVIFCLGT